VRIDLTVVAHIQRWQFIRLFIARLRALLTTDSGRAEHALLGFMLVVAILQLDTLAELLGDGLVRATHRVGKGVGHRRGSLTSDRAGRLRVELLVLRVVAALLALRLVVQDTDNLLNRTILLLLLLLDPLVSTARYATGDVQVPCVSFSAVGGELVWLAGLFGTF